MICKICKKELNDFHSLSNHLVKHKISIKSYYDIYLKKEDEGTCFNCGRLTNFKSSSKGYHKFCSRVCVLKFLSKDQKINLKKSQLRRGKTYEELYGIKKTKEIKEKQSTSHIGLIKTEEHRKNLSISLTGKHLLEEHRHNISLGRKGKNLGHPGYIKKQTEESNLKRSKKMKEYRKDHPAKATYTSYLQKILFKEILESTNLEVILNYFVKTEKHRFIDVAIPQIKLGFEYDGEHWHNKENDNLRDIELSKVGWEIIYINKKIMKEIKNIGINEISHRTLELNLSQKGIS